MTKDKYRYSKDVLGNGLRVVTVEVPHVHSISLAIYAKVGSRFETPEDNGLSHFLEHMFFRGSARYPTSFALNDAIEQRGGTLQATTSRDYTAYFLRTHPRLLRDGVEILGELFRAPRFAQIDVERGVVLEEMLEDYDDKGRDICAEDLTRAALWAGHPLGYKIIGTRDNLLRFTRADLERHRAAFYGAKNLVFAAVGAVERSAVVRTARRFLGGLPSGREATITSPPAAPSAPRLKSVRVDDHQTEIVVSFLALPELDPDFTALLVLRRLLDDGISSRLQKRLCEELGLAYDLGASTECFVDTGILDIDVTADRKKSDRLLREIFSVVSGLRDGRVAPSELDKVKRRFGWDLEFALDNVGDLSSWFGATELFYEPERFEAQIRRVNAVTLGDVRRVARRVFRPERLAVAALGPIGRTMERRMRQAVLAFH
jgi:predicted Zn-dependent peptidase